MKNMKIKKKLLLGFFLVAIFSAIVAVVSIMSLSSLSESQNQMYLLSNNINLIDALIINLGEQRIYYRQGIIDIESPERRAAAIAMLRREMTEFEDLVNLLRESLQTTSGQAYLQQIRDNYAAYVPLRDNLVRDIEAGNMTGLPEKLDEIVKAVQPLIDTAKSFNETGLDKSEQDNKEGAFLALALTWVMIGLGALAVGLAVFFGTYISKLIATPISRLAEAAEKLSLGNVDVDVAYDSKDEVGDLSQSFQKMADAIREQAKVLLRIADSDYTVNIGVRSENDDVNRAINTMLDSNNSLISNIRTSSQQVSTASKQMSDGAQNLASGSTQQAATIEEFSASITEVQNQSEENTRMAQEAFQDVQRSEELMKQSMVSMERMTQAMRQIDDSSQNIAKIIKVIDDIAFQTNILALNAAVEAARAGQYGKGFAVVAEEVRNLASKSAEAAKETSALIAASTGKVSEGNAIVAETNESLKAVAEIAGKTAASMGNIQESSRRQSVSITEITSGIGQLSSVVQENSATAEESAASAQEMSAQAEMLNGIVTRFKLRTGAGAYAAAPAAPQYDAHQYAAVQYAAPPAAADYQFLEENSDKYSF
ncbi:MAG: methyl-accepting chemotaxis protein [Peptococcaceae bacterium]|jgi:methyl-accepting chemotaxis protein|nr:methyl-accepting chemotaxis protein [Peptococcaceae bacterium]